MRAISRKSLVLFYQKHSEAKLALEDWYKKVSDADWNNFAEMKSDFNSVDNVGNRRFVFNIRGNHYRIVALVLFVPKRVYIRFVGTHSEYDEINDIKNL